MNGSESTGTDGLVGALWSAVPLVVTLLLFGGTIWRLDRWFAGKPRSLTRPATMLAVTVAGVLAVLLAAPLDHETRGQLIGLFGVALTAVIALSSTTFVANAMAGLMLRSLRNFGPGDFIRMDECFGRVTERGLFHTEIQTEERDLTTIPNLLLATRSTTVVRASGTIISASVSLGYDVPRADVERVLRGAGESAGLEEPFVQVVDLGDFSVTYRAAGFLPEVKQLVSARSRLRAAVMDALHEAEIEIVSPTFMNQRQLGDRAVIPRRATPGGNGESEQKAPESVIFDKADAAEELAAREKELELVRGELLEAEKEAKANGSGEGAGVPDHLRRRVERLEADIAARREAHEGDEKKSR